MSVTENIRKKVLHRPRGEPFTSRRFLKLGSRAAVDQALSRLVKEGVISRVARGVFVRPKKSRFVENVLPEISRVMGVIAKSNGETIQVHGAEAARRFKLSTQMPTTPVFYTSGPSREIQIGKQRVKLIHTSSPRKLQYAGQKTGLALSALWYLGKENVTPEVIQQIQAGLSEKEFKQLRTCNMPAWMRSAIETYQLTTARAA